MTYVISSELHQACERCLTVLTCPTPVDFGAHEFGWCYHFLDDDGIPTDVFFNYDPKVCRHLCNGKLRKGHRKRGWWVWAAVYTLMEKMGR